MIVTGCGEEVRAFVRRIMPECGDFNNRYSAIGIARDGELVAGIIYHNWVCAAGNVEMSIAATSPRWISRPVLWCLFGAAFEEPLNCRRVTARTDASNTRARRLIEGLGFQLEGLLRQAAIDGGDVLIYGLLREECKYVRRR